MINITETLAPEFLENEDEDELFITFPRQTHFFNVVMSQSAKPTHLS